MFCEKCGNKMQEIVDMKNMCVHYECQFCNKYNTANTTMDAELDKELAIKQQQIGELKKELELV